MLAFCHDLKCIVHFKSVFIFKIYSTELSISEHINDFQLLDKLWLPSIRENEVDGFKKLYFRKIRSQAHFC